MEFNIKMVLGVNLDPDKVKQQMREYLQQTPTPTYIGLLNYLGVTREEIDNLQYSTNTQQQQIYRATVMFKQMLEQTIEENIVYQNQRSGYDYKLLMEYLKKTNPRQYGDKVVAIEKKMVHTNNELSAPKTNVSGISIMEKNLC